MPDEPRQSSAVQIASLIINCIQTLVIAWLTVQTHKTDDKVQAVQQVQQEVKQDASESAKEIKSAVEERANKIDAEAEKQRRATAAMLYGNWKYISENAMTADDVKAAADAKRRWEEFTAPKKP